MLLVLIKPIDARSAFLLESNFMALLESFELEGCRDPLVRKASADIVGIYEAYAELPCRCAVCLANLRASPHPSSISNHTNYSYFPSPNCAYGTKRLPRYTSYSKIEETTKPGCQLDNKRKGCKMRECVRQRSTYIIQVQLNTKNNIE